eukprot:scaffold120324_cov49-Attheya_sp.AAC.2
MGARAQTKCFKFLTIHLLESAVRYKHRGDAVVSNDVKYLHLQNVEMIDRGGPRQTVMPTHVLLAKNALSSTILKDLSM